MIQNQNRNVIDAYCKFNNQNHRILYMMHSNKLVYGKSNGPIVMDQEGEYDPTHHVPYSEVTFVDMDGAPKVVADEEGRVSEFSYTEASTETPVVFDDTAAQDTGFIPFELGYDFEINITAYFSPNQDFSAANGNQPTLLQVKRELSPYYGLCIRRNQSNKGADIAVEFTNEQNKKFSTVLWKATDYIYSGRITFINNDLTVFNKRTQTQLATWRFNPPNMPELKIVLGGSYMHSTGQMSRLVNAEIYEFSIIRL